MKLKILIGCFIAIAILTGLVFVLKSKLNTATLERKQAIDFSIIKQDSIEYLTTKLGQESARSLVKDLTIKNIQRLQSEERIAWIKQIQGVNKRMSNVEQIMATSLKINIPEYKIPLSTLINSNDTSQVSFRTFDNQDQWCRITGFVFPDTVVTNGIEIPVPLQSVVYWQRGKVLGLYRGWPAKKTWYKETKSDNPYVKITHDELIRVTKRK